MSTRKADSINQDTEIDVESLVADLGCASRLSRQHAAVRLAQYASADPSLIAEYGLDIIDALNRPEARTRWECLDMLTSLVSLDSRMCDKAIIGAEASLFDETSGPVRLASFRFLTALGATTENRSERVWPLIDEAIQCYHGDPEFQDMLISMIEFSAGRLSAQVKEELVDRMSFDAQNAKGTLRRRARQIIENIS